MVETLLQPSVDLGDDKARFNLSQSMRLVFGLDGYWTRYPNYDTSEQYQQGLTTLVNGALLALGSGVVASSISISMQPPGIPWIE